jgi:8-oxo-dGTP pyrophosphatase MutT (NUDIX family)
MHEKNSFCSYCGSAFSEEEPFPRTCRKCSEITYLNPVPVSVVLLPVGNGLLMTRRGIEPGIGKLALPGGFMEINETWQEAAARELYEETQIIILPEELKLFDLISIPGLLLVFSLANKKEEKELPPFIENEETLERLVLYKPEELAFPSHTKVTAEFFKMYSLE